MMGIICLRTTDMFHVFSFSISGLCLFTGYWDVYNTPFHRRQINHRIRHTLYEACALSPCLVEAKIAIQSTISKTKEVMAS